MLAFGCSTPYDEPFTLGSYEEISKEDADKISKTAYEKISYLECPKCYSTEHMYRATNVDYLYWCEAFD